MNNSIYIKVIFTDNPYLSIDDVNRRISGFSKFERISLRPFFPTKFNILLTNSFDRADYIITRSTAGSNAMAYHLIQNIPQFKQYEHKFLFYCNDDNPEYLYDNNKCIKLVAQPSRESTENIKHNITTIPLIMGDYCLLSDSFIERCRAVKKVYDFGFIGKIGHNGREVLSTLPIESYLFRDTAKLDFFGNSSTSDKIDILEKYLLDVASCRFFFCPRGVGSSSFRLYESMMVGTVPIITGAKELPYTAVTDWSKFSIIGNIENLHELSKFASSISNYNNYRENAINFWSKYYYINNAYNVICKRLNLV